MIKKIILVMFIFSFSSHCGFTPLYSNKSEVNFSIISIELEGDKTINNYLKNNLIKFKNDQIGNKFALKIETNYKKNILSKNKAAETTNFELSANALFKVFLNDVMIRELVISEKEVMDKNDDDFEEAKNERIIKQNFASSISNKLITELSILNDN